LGGIHASCEAKWELSSPAGTAEAFKIAKTLRDPSEYLDRAGYDPAFIGAGPAIELPGLGAWSSDAVQFEWNGKETTSLRPPNRSVAATTRYRSHARVKCVSNRSIFAPVNKFLPSDRHLSDEIIKAFCKKS